MNKAATELTGLYAQPVVADGVGGDSAQPDTTTMKSR